MKFEGFRRVLMPCRALEAFRLRMSGLPSFADRVLGLNALSGIGGVQTLQPLVGWNGVQTS